ncbi:hypothetical protein [Streptomyces sp. NPDC040750]|uniref:hypothetical protein n=1 Tax=Streptomyces sp. NPDC040750 TaxID=3154491 RepID=UPI0033F67AAD
MKRTSDAPAADPLGVPGRSRRGTPRRPRVRVPTDLPGGDATLTWNATTLILVEAGAAGRTGIGWTYGSAAAAPVVRDELSSLAEPFCRGCGASCLRQGL